MNEYAFKTFMRNCSSLSRHHAAERCKNQLVNLLTYEPTGDIVPGFVDK